MAIFTKKLSSVIGAALVGSILPMTLASNPAAATTNIVTNGGFENPNIPGGSFGIFPGIPGWSLLPGSRGSGIEVQDNVAGSPFTGNQFVELDSNGVTGIYQDLATDIGQTYKLEFAFSPRPGVAQNITNIKWGGSLVDTLSASGVGLPNTNWKTFSYDLVANSSITRLSFDNLTELSDSLGSYIDDVKVTAVPEPASMLGLLAFGAFGATSLIKRKQPKAEA